MRCDGDSYVVMLNWTILSYRAHRDSLLSSVISQAPSIVDLTFLHPSPPLPCVPCRQGVGRVLGGAWASIVSPFAVFGDKWLLNFFFLFSLGMFSFALLFKAPKQ
jgi:hypothetical protein